MPKHADRFQADLNHLAHEANDVLFIIGSVGIGANASPVVFGYLILVDHRFQRAAIARAVLEDFRWNAAERDGRIDAD